MPPDPPELNPVERVWLDRRERVLSRRVFADANAIVDACCAAWNSLVAESARRRSATSRGSGKSVYRVGGIHDLYQLDVRRSLSRTEQRIEKIWEIIASQARLISQLAAQSHDTSLAEELRVAYEQTLAVLEARRNCLQRELKGRSPR